MPRQRVQLTDQALVAVHVARRTAAGREASAADLLVGLASEPDGLAGRWLRAQPGATARLCARAAAAAPALPPLSTAVADAARRAGSRPPATADLLAAALAVGGDDLADLLDVCGFDAGALRPARLPAEVAASDETVTVRQGADLAPAAERIVGRVRALGGGAVDVVAAVADAADSEVAGLVAPADPDTLAAARVLCEAGGVDERWDRGLDAVLAGAATIAGEGPVTPRHLLSAAVVGGGEGPLAILEAARRLAGEEGGTGDEAGA